MGVCRCVLVCLACAVIGMTAGAADAVTRISITTYSIGGPEDQFAAFDPALGTLRSVTFTITGAYEPIIVSDAGPDEVYVEPLFVTASHTGLFAEGFSTSLAPTVQGLVVSNGPGIAQVLSSSFQDSFTFDAQSDATGFVADSLGGILNGRVSDFVASRFGRIIEELTTYSAYAIGHDGSILPSAITTATGGGLVTYTYSPAAAPEPATWATMLIGIALLGASLRRRALGVPLQIR